MLRHIVMWRFKEGFSPEENYANAKKVKELLEALPAVIDGIIELKVYIDPLPVCNRNVILNSLFESEKALKEYAVHPAHVEAGVFVRSVLTDRADADYIE